MSSSTTSDLRNFLLPEEKTPTDQKSKYQTKAEKKREGWKIYYHENKEHIKVYQKIYRQKNKAKMNVYQKAYNHENKEHRKAYQKRYRQKNKEKFKVYRQEHKEQLKAYSKTSYQRRKEENKWVSNLKRSRGCLICGENNPDCLDFDHIDTKTKEYSISFMIRRKNFSREAIEKEIAKCQILCSNCHRKKTVNLLRA